MNNRLEVIQTAKNTADRMSEKKELYLSPISNLDQNIIEIDEGKEYQVMEGFGGAFTEAAADTFYKMSSQKRKEILEAY
jgi:glucosylceramidase